MSDQTEKESRKLHELFSSEWKETLKEHPELATYVGVPGHNDRWTDHSFEAIDRRRKRAHRTLTKLQEIDRGRLSRGDRLNYDLYLYRTREEIEAQRFPDELMPLSQLQGVQQDASRIVQMTPSFTLEDFESAVERLRSLPKLLQQTTALMERGLQKGIVPPDITIKDVPRQISALIASAPADSPFAEPFKRFPETIPAAKREKVKRAAANAIATKVHPAFDALKQFIETRYLPRCRTSTGLCELPDGQAWYALKARQYTTTKLTPCELHDLGLSEVERIRGEFNALIKKLSFRGGFPEFAAFLRTDPSFYHTDPDELLREYRDICKRIDPGLVKLFGRLPRLPFGVTPVPGHSAKTAPTAYYMPGSLEGGRPGWYFANTYNLKARPRWEMEALTLHEAVPGHHLQISLAREMSDVPEFRKHDMHIAFIEGWALYAESLGAELGCYQDPYSRAGQLSYEIWRAARLVVDTGIHAMGWSRKKAIDYLTTHSCKIKHDAIVEIDRYIALPGQALAYKVGELCIQKLRQKAATELGPLFDLRAFHDALLANAALPLEILEDQVRSWLEDQSASAEPE
ncbi:MAG: DUF885 domain-containing protein [Candidatus Wallbacteria bacterium]|nr:DUF885 domain-containing protein [Candidatus Wallbacteria bacterium]